MPVLQHCPFHSSSEEKRREAKLKQQTTLQSPSVSALKSQLLPWQSHPAAPIPLPTRMTMKNSTTSMTKPKTATMAENPPRPHPMRPASRPCSGGSRRTRSGSGCTRSRSGAAPARAAPRSRRRSARTSRAPQPCETSCAPPPRRGTGSVAFDTVSITLDAPPPGVPGSAVVVLVDVAEARGRAAGDFGVFANTQTRSCSLEGSLKLKNLLGFCETWDASGALELDKTAELSAGLQMPRIGAIPTPLMARISFLSEDWLKSSFKEHLMGISVGLLSTMNHNLAYDLTWRKLTDPTRKSSNSVQEELGHSLLSSIKYAYKVGQRDSSIRPTRGYAFLSSSHVGGLAPGSKYSRFLRQEFDLRVALPLGVLNGALNAGVAAGVIHPLERGSTGTVSPLPERFYLGGSRPLVCRLGGPSSLLGFKTRGLGATEFRTHDPNNSDNGNSTSPELNGLGGDIAVTAFADLSFDLPLKLLRELGIHGHAFVCAGNLGKLTDCDLRKFPVTDFLQTFRSSAGFGVVVPTRLFRIEMNYCYILKQLDHDKGKTGIQFNFSSP